MKLNNRHLTGALGLGLATGIRALMRTLDCRGALYEPSVDPCHVDCRRRSVYVFWHEYIMMPLYLRGHCDLSMLMSRHRDADLLSRLAMHFGFGFVRGSTARGGERAIRELLSRSRSQHLTITPDGPRGPRRVMAPGCIYVASRTGMPLVVIAIGYDRPWRVGTWDRFAVPRPFSRARAIMSSPLEIPPGLDRDGIEHYRRRMEKLLMRLTHEAEAWAVAGTRKVGEITGIPTPHPVAVPGSDIFDTLFAPADPETRGDSLPRRWAA